MNQGDTLREQAARCLTEATERHNQGDLPQTIAALRHAVLLFAAADDSEIAATAPVNTIHRRARADACQRCADTLTQAGELPEATNVYQEAADLYAQLPDPDAPQQAQRCAQQILAAIAALRQRPHDRLYLLIAHHERRQRQLELQPGSEQAQAQCAFHIARVFHRRERYEEARARYQEALRLNAQAPANEEVLLATADCHQRLAELSHRAFDDLPAAERHYREAIPLYAQCETQPSAESAQETCRRALADIQRRLRAARRFAPRREE